MCLSEDPNRLRALDECLASGLSLVGNEEPSRLLQQGRVGSDLNFAKVIQHQGEKPTSGVEVGDERVI